MIITEKTGKNCHSNNRNRSKHDFLPFPKKWAINGRKGVAFVEKPIDPFKGRD